MVTVAGCPAGAPVAAGIGLAVFPQLYRYTRQLALDAMAQPCVIAAASRGVGRWTVLVRHCGALASPQLLALVLHLAQELIQQTIAPSSWKADANNTIQLVSGATLTSRAFIQSLQSALLKAHA
jgi:hypothetical protein